VIALAHTTALLLDHLTGDVKPIEYDGELDTLKQLLGVNLVDASMLDHKTIVFYDDAAIDKGYTHGFTLKYGRVQVEFLGPGLVTGDSAGQNAPLDIDHGKLRIEYWKVKE
jgi:hypothetical protein